MRIVAFATATFVWLVLSTTLVRADALDTLRTKGITPDSVGPKTWTTLSETFYGSPSQTFQLYFAVADPATKERIKAAMECYAQFGRSQERGFLGGANVGDVLLKGLECVDRDEPGKSVQLVRDAEVKPSKWNEKKIADAKADFNRDPSGYVDSVFGSNAFAYWGAMRTGSIRNYPRGAEIMMANNANYRAIEVALSDAKANRWGCKEMTPNGIHTTGGQIYCMPRSMWNHVIAR